MDKSIPADMMRAWVEVDLDALVRNARSYVSRASRPLLPMVKANAYGLGAVPVARALEAVEPWGYGVATTEEGGALRRGGITRPIVAFSPLLPDDVNRVVGSGIRPVIGDLGTLRAWLALGPLPFHLEIDTGMSRAGLRWDDGELGAAAGLLADAEGWEGVFTHFHSADLSPGSMRQQGDRFKLALDRLGRRPALVHYANSAAARWVGPVAADLARPGIYLYGGNAGAEIPESVVAVRARVVGLRRIRAGDTVSYAASCRATRDTNIATVAIGYADGVPRSLGNVGSFELDGRLRPIAGRVTMDMTMLDLGDDPSQLGSVATYFGAAPTLESQAVAAGTISYELLTSLGDRLPRVY